MSKHIEDDMQIKFVNWIKVNHYNSWLKIHHSPNGGKRHIAEALKFKNMGVKKGFPDLALFERRGKFSGLVIELKSGKGKLKDEQIERLKIMGNDGWSCFVCFDLESAKITFQDYISLPGIIDIPNDIWLIRKGQKVIMIPNLINPQFDSKQRKS